MRDGDGGIELGRRHVDKGFGTIGGRNFNHDPDPQIEADYEKLRKKARDEDKLKGQCFGDSREAYQRGDGAGAKKLSNQGKEHAVESDKFDAKASSLIFKENNKSYGLDVIDLHGLFVHEAVEKVTARIEECLKGGVTQLHVIVGKGTHSVGHVQKLKPAIEELCQDRGLQYETEENEGRILVDLPRQDSSNQYNGGQNEQEEQYDEIERLVRKLFKKYCCTVM